MNPRATTLVSAFLVAFLCGCATDYSWRSSVPETMRTVAVPTFRNESDVMELGVIASRQVLREFQREGTFKIRRAGDAAIEVQGVVKSVSAGVSGYDRTTEMVVRAYDLSAVVEVTVVDRRARKVLVDSRVYRPAITMTAGRDLSTARREAAGRLADELSRQVVDDVLNLKW